MPLAAQLVCTPAVAAISGQVSVVAVLSNVLAAPAVGPTTVLGLVGGLVTLVWPFAGHLIGWVAGWPAWWIVAVAHRTSGLRGAAVSLAPDAAHLSMLAVVCLLTIAVMPSLLRSPWRFAATAAVLVAALLQPGGRLGWPPQDWLLVMCDVGQGDALVLSAGAASAVVVDAGPDPAAVDRCLDDLGVRHVPLVVLTHFHADHIDGVPGVLGGRSVDAIEVSPIREPRGGAEAVDRWAAAADVPVAVAAVGESWTAGPIAASVLGPPSSGLSSAGEDEGTIANNASVVMRVEVRGHVFLLAGDAEPEEEDAILSSGASLAADVVKVSHHGSENQEPAFYEAAGAAVALVSVGADNDYGHPAAATLALLTRLGRPSTAPTSADGRRGRARNWAGSRPDAPVGGGRAAATRALSPSVACWAHHVETHRRRRARRDDADHRRQRVRGRAHHRRDPLRGAARRRRRRHLRAVQAERARARGAR